MVFKALNDLAPDYLSSMFTERSTSGYVLRDYTNKLNVPLPRTNYEILLCSYTLYVTKNLMNFYRVKIKI